MVRFKRTLGDDLKHLEAKWYASSAPFSFLRHLEAHWYASSVPWGVFVFAAAALLVLQ